MIGAIISSFAYISLFGQIAILILVLSVISDRFFKTKLVKKLHKMLAPHAFYLAFLVALAATLGSLFLSEVAKFQPCVLCWYQRIAMYPQVILLYMAIMRNEKTAIIPYSIALSVIGGIISIYHYFIQLVPQSSLIPCSQIGGVSCIKGYTFYFGYISIPLMALTSFVGIIILLVFSRRSQKQ